MIKALPAELQKVAIKELGEVPSRIAEDLRTLKSWIEQQPHLKARTDDQFLIQFLRGTKYSLEKAKSKLDFFYAFRSKFRNFGGFVDVDCPKFQAKVNVGELTVLPTPLNDCGPRILLLQVCYPTDKFHMEEIQEPNNALHELLMISDPYACIYGIVYVIDLAKCTLDHILQITPAFVKKLSTFYVKALPLRIRAIYYINVPAAAAKVFTFLLPFCPEKMRQKIFICGSNVESLAKYMPLEYLPKEYGGENGSLKELKGAQLKLWDEYREYFKENAEYGTDETLRHGSPMDFDAMFGVCGSFRQLNVD